MSIFNAFMFENLRPLDTLGKNTVLSIYEPSKKLYTVKRVPANYLPCYRKIQYGNAPSLSKIAYIDNASSTVVCEYISGDSLAEILKEYRTVAEDKALKYVSEICSGLSVLHRMGIVHRDINPNNIIISADDHAKIIDYGIIRAYEPGKYTDTEILGTPGYAAPEQFGFSQSDMRTDIYSVGVLLNVMLTGEMPNVRLYGGRTGKIIKRCIQIDAKNRYSTIDELKADLLEKGYDSLNASPAERFIAAFPGLRSKKIPVAVVSAILYCIVIMVVVRDIFFVPSDARPLYLKILFWILHLIIPFICFSDFLNIWERLPFTRNSSAAVRKKTGYIVGCLSIFFAYILISIFSPL